MVQAILGKPSHGRLNSDLEAQVILTLGLQLEVFQTGK